MFGKTESGRSMIEMLGVLAIIGILSAGGIAGYTMAMNSYHADKAMEKFQIISTEIITAFGDIHDYSALNDINNVGKLHLDLESPYGGQIGVNGAKGYFYLTMSNIPEQSCVKISTALWGDDYAFGSNPTGTGTEFTENPFLCNEGNNTMVFTYQVGIAHDLNNGTSSGNAGSSTGHNSGN